MSRLRRGKKLFGSIAQRVVDTAMGAGLMQEENTVSGERYVTPGIGALIRQAGAESCVLLKNDGVLPLRGRRGSRVRPCTAGLVFRGLRQRRDVHTPIQSIDRRAARRRGAMDERAGRIRLDRAGGKRRRHGWWGHWPYN